MLTWLRDDVDEMEHHDTSQPCMLDAVPDDLLELIIMPNLRHRDLIACMGVSTRFKATALQLLSKSTHVDLFTALLNQTLSPHISMDASIQRVLSPHLVSLNLTGCSAYINGWCAYDAIARRCANLVTLQADPAKDLGTLRGKVCVVKSCLRLDEKSIESVQMDFQIHADQMREAHELHTSHPLIMSGAAWVHGHCHIAGTMVDGHRYDAEEEVQLRVIRSLPGAVRAELTRTEREKMVDGKKDLTADTPMYLQRYMAEFGQCVENCTGFYHAPTGVLVLRTTTVEVTIESDVIWPMYHYCMIIRDDKTIVASGVDQDMLQDRKNLPVMLTLQDYKSPRAPPSMTDPKMHHQTA